MGPRAALAIITCRLSRALLRLYCSRAFIFSPWFFCKQQQNLKHGLHGLLQGVNFCQLSSFTRDVSTTVLKQNFSYTFWFPQNAETERVSPYKEHQSTECDTLNSAPKANKEKTFHSFIFPTKFGEGENFLHSDAPTGVCVLLSLMHTAGWINFPNHIALCSTDM